MKNVLTLGAKAVAVVGGIIILPGFLLPIIAVGWLWHRWRKKTAQ